MSAARFGAAAAAVLLLGAAPPRLRREATSSVETWKTADGRRMTHTINRRFTVAAAHPERTTTRTLILRETFDRLLDSGAEGEKSSVEVAAESDSGAPAWTIHAEGSSGESRDDNLYRVVRPGCCGSQDLSTYFSLLDGKELFTSDAPIFAIEVPNTSVRRFVGYHDLMAAAPVPGGEKNDRVIGALFWGSDRAPASRVLVLAPAGAKVDADFAAKKVAIVSGGKEVEEDRWDLWSADRSSDPAKIGGFSIRVRAFKDPDVLVEIPVEADRLAVEKATLGKGIRLE